MQKTLRALLLQSKFSSHAAPGFTLALFNSVSTALPAQPYVSKTERYPRGPQIKCSASFHSLSVSVSVFSFNFYLPHFHYLLSFFTSNSIHVVIGGWRTIPILSLVTKDLYIKRTYTAWLKQILKVSKNHRFGWFAQSKANRLTLF